MIAHDLIEEADKVSARIWPVLAEALGGKPSELQGIVLADLLAIWVAGHIVVGDPLATEKLGEDLLARHLAAVRELIQMYRSNL